MPHIPVAGRYRAIPILGPEFHRVGVWMDGIPYCSRGDWADWSASSHRCKKRGHLTTVCLVIVQELVRIAVEKED